MNQNALVELAITGVFAYLTWHASQSGRIWLKWDAVRREDNPGLFLFALVVRWIAVAVLGILGVYVILGGR
jgi:hypothetical protein